MKIKLFLLFVMLSFSFKILAISYQGELSESGNLYTGQADFQFRLFDSLIDGTQIGLTDDINNVEVLNGRFVVELELWNGQFDGSDFWLEISADVPSGSGNFVTLSPRHKITPVPYAEYAYDLDITGLQLRVTGTCSSNSAIQVIDSVGNVTCGTFANESHSHEFAEITNVPADLADGDDDTTYDGTDFALSNQSCSVGQVVSAIAANGSINCVNMPVSNSPPDCNGANQALQYDSVNGWSCIDITTVGPSAGQASGYEVTDSWGNTWDGVERQAQTWSDADMTCQSLGGRLPTLTELYKVSGAYKGEVGSVYESNYLWSRTWWNKLNKGRTRLNDGSIGNFVTTNLSPYRCVWPAATPQYFDGNNCMGEPGDACWNHVAYPNNTMVIDKMERPAVSYVAATDECAFVNAHLADQQDYAENAINGLPNGTNSWQWTSNHARWDLNTTVRWQNVDTAYDDFTITYASWGSRASGPYKFRCVGVNYPAGPYPTSVSNEFVATATQIKTSDAATPTAVFGDSIDGCFIQGGHMAHSRDIMELVRSGMTSGTGADYIWLSDRSSYQATQIAKWTGIDTAYTSFYNEYVSWDFVNLSAEYQHRCVFYPIDTAFAYPNNTQCALDTACQQYSNGASKIAVDSFDRTASTYLDATTACINEGGRLPNSLQLTEAIRAGLPNGSGQSLWTTDSSGNETNSNSYATVLKWNGTEPDFSPVYSGSATWSGKGATVHNYRCVWSNEMK
ncbi:MAG TPA: hypothetical protein PLX38_09275 [Gammaproteobacteria bacterium]|nr:hypothetical protein [Gammaproteobacteria bacterium]